MSAFCEPDTTTSMPQASCSSGIAPSDEIASTTHRTPRCLALAPRSRGRRRRRRSRSPHACRRAPSRRRTRRAARPRPRASASRPTRTAARRPRSRSGARSGSNARRNGPPRRRARGRRERQVRDGGLHRAAAGRGQAGPRRSASGRPPAAVRARARARPELGPAVVDERLGHRSLHLRRNRRRAGCHQVAGLGHSSEGTGPPRSRSVQREQDGDERIRDDGARSGDGAEHAQQSLLVRRLDADGDEQIPRLGVATACVPSPVTRSSSPSSVPAGTSTRTARSHSNRPAPSHRADGRACTRRSHGTSHTAPGAGSRRRRPRFCPGRRSRRMRPERFPGHRPSRGRLDIRSAPCSGRRAGLPWPYPRR